MYLSILEHVYYFTFWNYKLYILINKIYYLKNKIRDQLKPKKAKRLMLCLVKSSE